MVRQSVEGWTTRDACSEDPNVVPWTVTCDLAVRVDVRKEGGDVGTLGVDVTPAAGAGASSRQVTSLGHRAIASPAAAAGAVALRSTYLELANRGVRAARASHLPGPPPTACSPAGPGLVEPAARHAVLGGHDRAQAWA